MKRQFALLLRFRFSDGAIQFFIVCTKNIVARYEIERSARCDCIIWRAQKSIIVLIHRPLRSAVTSQINQKLKHSQHDTNFLHIIKLIPLPDSIVLLAYEKKFFYANFFCFFFVPLRFAVSLESANNTEIIIKLFPSTHRRTMLLKINFGETPLMFL